MCCMEKIKREADGPLGISVRCVTRFLVALVLQKPLSFLLVVTKLGSNCCQPAFKTREEEMQKATDSQLLLKK